MDYGVGFLKIGNIKYLSSRAIHFRITSVFGKKIFGSAFAVDLEPGGTVGFECKEIIEREAGRDASADDIRMLFLFLAGRREILSIDLQLALDAQVNPFDYATKVPISDVQASAWHLWESDPTDGVGPIMTVLGIDSRFLAPAIYFEWLARGLSQGHRFLLGEKFGNDLERLVRRTL